MNIETLQLPPGLRMEGVALPSTLAVQEQFQHITNGRDLVSQGEPLPEQWTIPVPKLLVRNDDGQTFSVEGTDSGLHLQPYVPGTPSPDSAEVPEPKREKKPELPDFWDRQADMLVDKVKDMGKDILKAGLMGAWNDPSAGGFLDGCFGKGEEYWKTLFDPDKLMSIGIGEATSLLTNELINLWVVDDKSSAAEQISRQLVSQYLAEAVRQELAGRLEELLALQPDSPGASKLDLIQSAFSTSGCFLAAKMTDITDHQGTLKSSAVRTQIHQIAAIRATDVHKCKGHPPNLVAEGNPTIIIEGKFAARQKHRTVCAAKIHTAGGSVYYGERTETVLDIQEPPLPSAPLPASLPPSKPAGKPASMTPAPAANDGKETPEETEEPESEGEPESSSEIKIASSKKDEEDLLDIDPADMTPEQLKEAMKEKLKELDPEEYERLEQDPNKSNDFETLYWSLKKAFKGLDYAKVLKGPFGKAYKVFSTVNKIITANKIAYGENPFYDLTKEVTKHVVSNTVGVAGGGFLAGACAGSGVGIAFTPLCAATGYIVVSTAGEEAVNIFFETLEQLPTNANYIWQYLTTPVDPNRIHVLTDWSKDPPTAGDSLTDAILQSQKIENDYTYPHQGGKTGE
ncbi:MAG: PAAR domain-containing protein [Bryobacteraceae bacterium]